MRRLIAPLLALVAVNPAAAEPWWRHAVIYEVYARSFADSDGDGVGDLNGITAHLPYLEKLGVDAIWLTPVYPSPQVDFGYDIADFEGVDPRFGTLADMDRLIAAAKARRIRVVLDLVLNHTSDQHPWFVESAASRTNAKADWYVWSDGVTDGPAVAAFQRRFARDGRAPPNNWVSQFGGSAWEWVPARRQFYYHQFYRQQPDLNWRNPAVEAAMFDAVRFWLERGVAGFRLDAVTSLFEDPGLRDEVPTGATTTLGDPKLRHTMTDDLPEEHAVIARLRALVDGYPGDPVLIGETWLPDAAAQRRWYGDAAHPELHLPMDLFLGFGGPRYTPDWFAPRLAAAENDFGGNVPLFVFDNHDAVRSIDKFADGVHDTAIAKGIAAILYLSHGSALPYYGAEIGMRTRPPATQGEVRDPIGLLNWPRDKGRDGERRPMQWTGEPKAGFTTGTPWLALDPDHATVNVATEHADPASLLRWTEALIALRRSEPAFRDGAMALLTGVPPEVLAWTRTAVGAPPVVVAINMGGATRAVPVGDGRPITITSSGAGAHLVGHEVILPPYTAWVGRLVAKR